VLHEIGRGVFGVCKKVLDVDTQEVFCAKLPTDEATAGTALRDELVFMRRCDHPNVARLIGKIQEGRTLKALLMPLMLGTCGTSALIATACPRTRLSLLSGSGPP